MERYGVWILVLSALYKARAKYSFSSAEFFLLGVPWFALLVRIVEIICILGLIRFEKESGFSLECRG